MESTDTTKEGIGRSCGSGARRRSCEDISYKKSAHQQQDFALRTGGSGAPLRTTKAWPWRRQSSQGGIRTWVQPISKTVVVAAVRASPRAALLPLALFALCTGLGLYGLMAAAAGEEQLARAAAGELARDAARRLELQIAQAAAPTKALQLLIQREPAWAAAKEVFEEVAPRLLAEAPPGTLQSLQLAPNLVVAAIHPLAGNEAALGRDLLAETDPARRNDTIAALALRNLTLAGPYALVQGGYGVLVRRAVFVAGAAPNETFGAKASGAACPVGLCWDAAAGLRLWGFVQGLARLDGLMQGGSAADSWVQRLDSYGPWRLSRTLPNGTRQILAAWPSPKPPSSPTTSDPLPTHGSRAPVSVPVSLPNAAWELALARRGGWRPAWVPWLAALVVAGSGLLAALLFGLLVGGQRHRALLRAMFPAKALARLQRGHNFSEEFETVTILFSDIVSYTSLSAGLRPLEVAEMLNELYCEFDGLVDRHGCYKVETIGDAFMAVGGCPEAEPAEAGAERMARMALAMLDRAAGFADSRGHRLKIRVGLHSGPAAAAVIGRKMPRYCLFGDTVNLASRMESTSQPMSIQVSAATAALLRRCASAADFALTPRGAVAIKGKGNMETFWLSPADRASAAAAPQAHAAAAAEPAFVPAAKAAACSGPLPSAPSAGYAAAAAAAHHAGLVTPPRPVNFAVRHAHHTYHRAITFANGVEGPPAAPTSGSSDAGTRWYDTNLFSYDSVSPAPSGASTLAPLSTSRPNTGRSGGGGLEGGGGVAAVAGTGGRDAAPRRLGPGPEGGRGGRGVAGFGSGARATRSEGQVTGVELLEYKTDSAAAGDGPAVVVGGGGVAAAAPGAAQATRGSGVARGGAAGLPPPGGEAADEAQIAGASAACFLITLREEAGGCASAGDAPALRPPLPPPPPPPPLRAPALARPWHPPPREAPASAAAACEGVEGGAGPGDRSDGGAAGALPPRSPRLFPQPGAQRRATLEWEGRAEAQPAPLRALVAAAGGRREAGVRWGARRSA